PQVQTDTAVQPSDTEHGELTDACYFRVLHPDVEQHMPINPMNIEIGVGQALPDGVLHDQRRYQQTESEAQPFDPAHSQMSADVERPESQREMDRERAIKRDRADRVAPDPFVEDAAPFHRLEGDVAEAVVEKVQEHIGKQNEAAGQPKPSRDRWPAPHARRTSRL